MKKFIITGILSGVAFILLIVFGLSDFVLPGVSSIGKPNFIAVFILGFFIGAPSDYLSRYFSSKVHL